ncbi:LLM class flavin-dependent oxidoreductase [Paenibacillus glycanilyticus]|uniref:LLM class flavin-dependent oxidoreductase n=1 Tax=Paenibacillus glycanilyticus TaxID=126569 RepID=UPI00203BAEC4|nr:LLM class flavin-dependent oxidoreductase [Paenibacillus glycanilyticus]MCM3627082.1 LLM class flavin-dependent oxidoreductase [Paenibacillus glycanilyticus]
MDSSKNDGKFEFGVYTLGDLALDPRTGGLKNAGERIKEIIQAAKAADEAGIDVFGVGEHHRLDFALSSPPVLLAAIAQATSRIRLTSATTVLGTADPVRVFEDFATLDLISGGRAEIIAGRGAYIESFPLFGFELNDYKELFAEKLELMKQLNLSDRITWNGRLRTPLENAEIAPRPEQPGIPVWVGVGSTAESAALAGRHGAGMALALLGGEASKYKHLVDCYREAGTAAGYREDELRVAITGHCYVAETTEQALEEFYAGYSAYYSQFMGGKENGISREDFGKLADSLAIGSPQLIAEKIVEQHKLFGHSRFMAQMDIGGMPSGQVEASIRLLAKEVAPLVREALQVKV